MPVFVQDGNPLERICSKDLIRRSLSLEDDKNVGISSSIPSMDGHRKRLKENLLASQRSSSYVAPAAPASFVSHSNMSQFHGNVANSANGITGLPYGPPSMAPVPSRSSCSSRALIPSASPTISIQMHPLQDNFINETMKRLRQVEMDRVTNAKRRKVALWNGDNAAAVASLASANEDNEISPNDAKNANNANAENVAPALSRTIKEEGSNANNDENTSLKPASFRSFLRSADERKPIPILEEMSRHSDVPQIVATSGGLITYRNEPFSNITQPIIPLSSSPSEANPNSPPSSNAGNRSNVSNGSSNSHPGARKQRRAPRPLTIFELIDPHSLPNLYGMLALALHDVGIVEVEGHDSREKSVKSEKSERRKEEDRAASSSSSNSSVSASSTVSSSAPSGDDVPSGTNTDSNGARSISNAKSSHLAITLPCKSFERHLTESRYNITIIFLNDPDLAPIKRCFLGIFTPFSTPAVVQNDECMKENQRNHMEGNEKRPAMPVGKIFRAEDERLCQFLLGSSHSCQISPSVAVEQS